MDFFEEIILAIIQAILEWFPVSSEGFIILTAVNIFGEPADAAFRIAIYFHLGTALAVLLKYRKLYLSAIFKDRGLLRLLILSTIATGLVGIPLYVFLSDFFTLLTGMVVTFFIGVALLITGGLLRLGKTESKDILTIDERKLFDEIALGIAQGFAILPGISRSGVTVTYLLVRGFKKKDAFEMSFIISLPAVLGAIGFDLLYKGTTIGLSYDYLFIIALMAVLGYIMMDVLLLIAKKLSFDKICYFLGVFTIVLVLLFYAFT